MSDASLDFKFKAEMEQENANKVEEENNGGKLNAFLTSNPYNLRNTITFTILNVGCSFSYHLLNFYVKYLPGDLYKIQLVSSLAEAAANLSMLIVTRNLTIQQGFVASFLISLTASVSLLFAKASSGAIVQYGVPLFLLTAKFGITLAFSFLYYGPFQFFEPRFYGLYSSIANTSGKLCTTFAPAVAESGGDVPMAVVICLCIASSIGSMQLK